MKWLACALLVGVFARHDTSIFLSHHTEFSARVWFYVLGGWWEMMLCGVLLVLLQWASGRWRYIAMSALWVGILEAAQMTCQLAVPNMALIPKETNLCDHVTGLPIGFLMTSLYLLVILAGVGKAWREQS